MAIFYLLLSMLLFAVLHSILARLTIKSWIRKRVGHRPYEAFYRIGYNFFSVITFLPVMAVLVTMPGTSVWEFSGLVAIVFRILQLVGLIGLTVSLLQIDLGRFAGLAQVRAYLNGHPLPLPAEALTVEGVYRLVRHPLYLFSIMLLWFSPTMTSTGLAFNITVTLYFIVGSWFEERTMIKIFGDTYHNYRKRVPWMIPFIKFP